MSETALDNPALYMTDLDEALFPDPTTREFFGQHRHSAEQCITC